MSHRLHTFFRPDQPAKVYLVCLVGTIFLFLPGLGAVHLFDWDEINFAECAREMIVLGDYLQVSINYQPFWEKPPLFIWMQVLSMKVFGIGELAARLPNVICAFFSMLVLYRIGRAIHSHRFGLIWIITYVGSLLPHFYFRSGIIDPWFNLFIFISFYLIFQYTQARKKNKNLRYQYILIVIAGFSCALACLTKGPVAWLIQSICFAVLWPIYRFRLYISPVAFLIFTLLAFSGLGIWFGLDFSSRGPWLMNEFLSYQYRLFSTPDAGHEGFPGFHFVVLLVGCFPASVFALRSFRLFSDAKPAFRDFQRWMIVLLFVVLILFSIVQSKIIHYSSLAYFPLTFLASAAIVYAHPFLVRWQKILLGVLAGLLALIFLAVPIAARFRAKWLHLIADPFARANLEVPVQWTGLEGLPILLLLLGACLGLSNLISWNSMQRIGAVFSGCGLALALLFYTIMPKVEPHTQGEAVRFFKSLQGQNVYVYTLGYKSYAHYFYAQPSVPSNPASYAGDVQQWLLKGDLDRAAYFSCRIDRAAEFRSPEYRQYGLQELYSKGGFVFFRRLPSGGSVSSYK
jgi:4-amino-4-deoxy-L-arabinose transferase-like glycosyltransferase